MTPIVYCPHCGTANRLGSRFCNRCGTELVASEAESDQQATPGNAPPLAADEGHDEEAAAQASADLPAAADSSDAADPLLTEILHSQPWLDPAREEAEIAGEGSGEEEPTDASDHDLPDADAPPARPPRLIAGIQGLLEPLDAASQAGARPGSWSPTPAHSGATQSRVPSDAAPGQPVNSLSDAEARHLRQLLSEPPTLLELDHAPARPQRQPVAADKASVTSAASPTPRRRPWIFWLLALALVSPFLLDALTPRTLPLGLPAIGRPGELTAFPASAAGDDLRWPGVAEAYDAVRDLPAERDVLIYWAYDPATAGEMDNVALPLVRHLLARRARLLIVSPLPQGPATARRLLARARAVNLSSSPLVDAPPAAVDLGYLPGGAATLPLLVRDLAGLQRVATRNFGFTTASSSPDPKITPALVILFAAETDDVQRWLEQVQPYAALNDADGNGLPVIAATSAVVDPVARAYWQSGQLSGLVSGFSGAQSYRQLLEMSGPTTERSEVRAQGLRLAAQNWGQVALLIVIVAGNAVALLGGRA